MYQGEGHPSGPKDDDPLDRPSDENTPSYRRSGMEHICTTAGLTGLRVFLRLAGISQSDLARSLGVVRQSVNDILTERQPPSARFRRDIPLIIGAKLDLTEADINDLRVWFFGPGRDHDEEAGSVLRERLPGARS